MIFRVILLPTIFLLLGLASTTTSSSAPPTTTTRSHGRPNIVWLHVESTDGRTYSDAMKDVVPIPNIRSLQDRGAKFENFYANSKSVGCSMPAGERNNRIANRPQWRCCHLSVHVHLTHC